MNALLLMILTFIVLTDNMTYVSTIRGGGSSRTSDKGPCQWTRRNR